MFNRSTNLKIKVGAMIKKLAAQFKQNNKLKLVLAIVVALSLLLTVALETTATAFWRGGHGRNSGKQLIDNGYIITMDSELGDFKGDILLEGDEIIEIAPEINTGKKVKKIDAEGMIVMPGLIDTHRHMWQGVVHGMATDLTFGQYFQQVLFGVAPKFTSNDMYTGNLLSAYEAIDAGVTTVLDWSHATKTRDHALSAIRALDKSNIRAVYAYGSPTGTIDINSAPTMEDLQSAMARTQQNPLLDFAVATATHEINPDAKDRFLQDIQRARELGVPITVHAGFAPRNPSIPQELHDLGLLKDDMTFIHANSFTEEDFRLIAEAGAHVSSSPEIEQQMNFGELPLESMLNAGVKPTVSLDVPSALTGDLFTQLRFLVQTQRFLAHQKARADGTELQELPYKLSDSLPYVTTNAAETLGLGNKVGSLMPGKQADLIMVDASDLNIFLDNPKDAVVHANSGNVDTVIVAGQILKRHGKLVNLNVNLDKLREQAKQANRRLLQE